MKKALYLAILAALTLIAVSPLLLAAPPHGRHATTGGSHIHATRAHTHAHAPHAFRPHGTATTATTFKPGTTTTGTTFRHNTVAVHSHHHHHHHPVTVKKTTIVTTKTTTAFHGKPLGAYALSHGIKFRGGVYYKGTTHRQWTRRAYLGRWRVGVLFDPATSGWYYWESRRAVYLPVSVIASYPPVMPAAGVTADAALASTLPAAVSDVPKADAADLPDVPEPPAGGDAAEKTPTEAKDRNVVSRDE